MAQTEPTLTPWPHTDPPTEAALNAALAGEGLAPHWWGNGPDDRYDRLDLPPFTTHSAADGPTGTRCVEGWRQE